MINFKSTILLLAFTIFLSSNVIAEGKNKIPQSKRVPAVMLDKAIVLVKAHHDKCSKEKMFIDGFSTFYLCFWL
jgi:hypothetical protein